MQKHIEFFLPFRLMGLLLIILIAMTGCALFSPTEYALFKPTVYELMKDPTLSKDGNVTDRVVVEFSNNLKNRLRTRMNVARIVREISGTTQVLTAAAATALGVAAESITAITALSASSAVMPELQSIFEAKGRAEAFNQGVTLIEDAEGRYFRAVNGRISTAALTPDGANFYIEVLASLKLVEKALVAQLPTIEELQRATGRLRHPIELVPNHLSLAISEQDGHFLITLGGPARDVLQEDTQIAIGKIAPDKDKNRINIEPKSPGTTTMTIVNDRGDTRSVQVTILAFKFTGHDDPIELGRTRKVRFTVGTPLKEARSSNPSVATVLPLPATGDYLEIKGVMPGKATITFVNDKKDESTLNIEVRNGIETSELVAPIKVGESQTLKILTGKSAQKVTLNKTGVITYKLAADGRSLEVTAAPSLPAGTTEETVLLTLENDQGDKGVIEVKVAQ